MKSNALQVIKYVRTLRHLQVSQLIGRLISPWKKSFAIRSSVAAPTEEVLSVRVNSESSPGLIGPFESEASILNQPVDLSPPVNWNPDDESYLWRFNLPYFNYVHDLGDDQSRVLIHDWITKNPIGLEPGWHPYPTSLRIINWIRRGCFDEEILESLFRQCEYLYNLTETHLGGNHLLENARSLVFAASFFKDSPRANSWLKRAVRIYKGELPNQVLDDGGHYERSPMYHAIVLEGLLDVIHLLKKDGHPFPETWISVAKKMLDFLASVTHPDGNIALFNDATQEIARSTKELVFTGLSLIGYEPVRRTTFPDSGYFVHRSDDIFLCIDGGPIGPNHLPAHAHGDIFSYELSYKGSQFIVDSGVYEYEEGRMRDYVRSTAAHNTLEVDGVNQAEFWSSFRVARRYDPEAISFISNNNRCRFEGVFDGYSHLIGDDLRHLRTIDFETDESKLVITDTLTGKRNHKGISRIHLHPDVEVRPLDNGYELRRGNESVRLEVNSPHQLSDSWYCPEFGMRLATKVVEIDVELNSSSIYSLTFNTG